MPYVSISAAIADHSSKHRRDKVEYDGRNLEYVNKKVIVPWDKLPLPSYSAVLNRGSEDTKFNSTLADWRSRNEQQARVIIEKKEAAERAERERKEALERAEKERKEAEKRARLDAINRQRALEGRVENMHIWGDAPLEVKARIIDIVLKEYWSNGILDVRGRCLCNIFRVSSDLRMYAVWRLLQTYTIMICSGKDIDFFRSFLAHNNQLYGKSLNDKDVYQHVRSLAFPFFDCYKPHPAQPFSGDLLLALACENLNYLAIRFHVNRLIKYDRESDNYSHMPCADLVATHHLDKILKLKEIKVIYLNVQCNKTWSASEDIKPLWEVKLWLERKFTEQLKKGESRHKVQVQMQAFGPGWGYAWKRIEMVRSSLEDIGSFTPEVPQNAIPCAGYRNSE